VVLVTHAELPFGGRVAARLLCGGDAVRAQVAEVGASRRQLNKLRTGGAEVICCDLLEPDPKAKGRLWRGVSGVVHASLAATVGGKEVVASLSDLEDGAVINRAVAARAQGLVLLSPPTPPETRARLGSSGLPYTLLEPSTREAQVDLGGGAFGHLLERRRQIFFLPLQAVADIAVFAASLGLQHARLQLPTEVRRYSDLLGTVESLLERPEPPLSDALLAELVLGSPWKLVTPGVARALGLRFSERYLEQVFAQFLAF
jgi:hypothetical protein